MAKKWSDEQSEKLERLWNSGLSASKIAVQLGISRNAILGRVYRQHFVRRSAGRRKARQMSHVEIEQVRRMWSEGFTRREIARTLAVPQRAIGALKLVRRPLATPGWGVSVKMDAAMIDALREKARDANHSLAGLIRHVLAEWLEKLDDVPKR